MFGFMVGAFRIDYGCVELILNVCLVSPFGALRICFGYVELIWVYVWFHGWLEHLGLILDV